MKHPTNFRLDEQVLKILDFLASDLETTKTEIIERAVLQFAKTTAKNRNDLLRFAGCFKDEDTDMLLSFIQTEKAKIELDVTI